MKSMNQEILALFDKYGTDVRRALRENKKLSYLYALAELRENLLEWYDFKPQGRVLQIGADFGALTGLLARRASSVTVLDASEESLEVVKARYPQEKKLIFRTGRLTEYARETAQAEEPAGRYDYVTLIGTFDERETLEAQLQAAKSLLAPGGTLIMAVCNRFGIKYFAGTERDAVTASKRELEALLPGGRFYYPMPDYRLAGELYSDGYLPKKGDLTGALAVYDMPKYLLMDVGAAYDAVCEDGRFDQFANSFLVFWEKEG